MKKATRATLTFITCLWALLASVLGMAQIAPAMVTPPDSLATFRFKYQPRAIQIKTQMARPDSAPPPTNHINSQINQLMDSIAENNRNIEYAEGFRISIYTGNNREIAMRFKDLIYRLYPQFRIYFTYKLPTFKLKIGNYFNKLDAQRDIKKLKADFPDALIVQDAIDVR
jgi:hypothetical protein